MNIELRKCVDRPVQRVGTFLGQRNELPRAKEVDPEERDVARAKWRLCPLRHRHHRVCEEALQLFHAGAAAGIRCIGPGVVFSVGVAGSESGETGKCKGMREWHGGCLLTASPLLTTRLHREDAVTARRLHCCDAAKHGQPGRERGQQSGGQEDAPVERLAACVTTLGGVRAALGVCNGGASCSAGSHERGQQRRNREDAPIERLAARTLDGAVRRTALEGVRAAGFAIVVVVPAAVLAMFKVVLSNGMAGEEVADEGWGSGGVGFEARGVIELFDATSFWSCESMRTSLGCPDAQGDLELARPWGDSQLPLTHGATAAERHDQQRGALQEELFAFCLTTFHFEFYVGV
ncbi:hypothetical protein GGX14DRAFT_619371 [Mycena pura]|uniref:Uncharacterized protein n=1 Tax=Mycena pura TaxID=153505 RepID=A0AAD6VPI0_9AGAR|nr:hypothetical protein GGX14DRAFT_619371 [Mycena pura]